MKWGFQEESQYMTKYHKLNNYDCFMNILGYFKS